MIHFAAISALIAIYTVYNGFVDRINSWDVYVALLQNDVNCKIENCFNYSVGNCVQRFDTNRSLYPAPLPIMDIILLRTN